MCPKRTSNRSSLNNPNLNHRDFDFFILFFLVDIESIVKGHQTNKNLLLFKLNRITFCICYQDQVKNVSHPVLFKQQKYAMDVNMFFYYNNKRKSPLQTTHSEQ